MNDVPLTRRRLLTAAGVVVGMTSLGTLSVAGEAGPVKPSVNGVIEQLNQSVMLLQTTQGRQLVQIHDAAFNRDGAASYKAFMRGDEVVAELEGDRPPLRASRVEALYRLVSGPVVSATADIIATSAGSARVPADCRFYNGTRTDPISVQAISPGDTVTMVVRVDPRDGPVAREIFRTA